MHHVTFLKYTRLVSFQHWMQIFVFYLVMNYSSSTIFTVRHLHDVSLDNSQLGLYSAWNWLVARRNLIDHQWGISDRKHRCRSINFNYWGQRTEGLLIWKSHVYILGKNETAFKLSRKTDGVMIEVAVFYVDNNKLYICIIRERACTHCTVTWVGD